MSASEKPQAEPTLTERIASLVWDLVTQDGTDFNPERMLQRIKGQHRDDLPARVKAFARVASIKAWNDGWRQGYNDGLERFPYMRGTPGVSAEQAMLAALPALSTPPEQGNG